MIIIKHKNNVNISESDFIQSLKLIQKGVKRRHKFNDAIDKISDGFVVCNLGDEFLNVALKLLSNAVNDYEKYPMIDWWLFEDVEKYVILSPDHINNPTNKDFKVVVKTPKQLYKYFLYYH